MLTQSFDPLRFTFDAQPTDISEWQITNEEENRPSDQLSQDEELKTETNPYQLEINQEPVVTQESTDTQVPQISDNKFFNMHNDSIYNNAKITFLSLPETKI